MIHIDHILALENDRLTAEGWRALRAHRWLLRTNERTDGRAYKRTTILREVYSWVKSQYKRTATSPWRRRGDVLWVVVGGLLGVWEGQRVGVGGMCSSWGLPFLCVWSQHSDFKITQWMRMHKISLWWIRWEFVQIAFNMLFKISDMTQNKVKFLDIYLMWKTQRFCVCEKTFFQQSLLTRSISKQSTLGVKLPT